MPLTAGEKFGPYEILAPIGAGGMGEVYRAHDHTLGRNVAVKVLPDIFAGNPDRLARFRHEARVLASLNHPNIAAIYGLEEFFGKQFLVMELAEGETLAERLKRTGPLPAREALEICCQVAEGLEAAHLKGVTHRDVKPANIKVTPEGRVKVLDFGLAKAIWGTGEELNASQIPTVTQFRSDVGEVAAGTPPYMSPEQTRGKPVDQRTDVWAFGCLLFELLTGKRCFQGETLSDTMAAILALEPALGTLPSATPGRARDVVRRCLQKDPNLRFQNMQDVLAALKDIDTGNRWGVIWRIAASIAVLAVLAGAVLITRPWKLPSLFSRAPVQEEKHLAVLQFANIGNDPKNQVFCDQLMESLTSNLTQLARFHDFLLIVPSSEVRRQSVSSPSDALHSFAVNLVITGSLEQLENKVVLRVNLVDTRTLRQLDARSIDVRLDELSQMEDMLLVNVAELLDLQLQPESRNAVSAGGTKVSDAYKAYVRGRDYLRRYDKEENLKLAEIEFKEALRLDDDYALAYVGLGEVYERTFDRTKIAVWLDRAQEQNDKAIKKNNRVAAAHVNQGITHVARGRYEEAVTEFNRALDLDPLNPDTFRELAKAYEAMKDPKKAEETYQRAVRLRPDDWLGHSRLGGFYYRIGRYEDAEKQFKKLIELTPDNVNGYASLGGLYLSRGRYDDAEPLLKRAIALKPSDGRAYSNLGTLYFQRARYVDAVPMFEKAVERTRTYQLVGNLADSYRWAPGFESKAKETYESALELAEKQVDLNPRDAAALSSAALYEAKLNQNAEALFDIMQAREIASGDKPIAFNAVVVLELIGRRKDALAILKELFKSGFDASQVEGEPELKKLRQDPTYIRMVPRAAAGNAAPTQPK